MSVRSFFIIASMLALTSALSGSARADGCAPRGVSAQVVRELRQVFARFGRGIDEVRRMALEIPDPAMRTQFLRRITPLEYVNRTRMIESGGQRAPLPGLALQRRIEFEMARRGLSGPSLENRSLIQSIQVEVSDLDGTLEYLADHLRRSLSDPYFQSLPESRAAQSRLLPQLERAIARGRLSYGEAINLSVESIIALDYYPSVVLADAFRVAAFETIWRDGGFPMPIRTPEGAGEFAFDDFVPGSRGGLTQLRVTRFEPGADIAQSRERLPFIDGAARYTDTEYARHDLGHFPDLLRGGEGLPRREAATARMLARLRRTGMKGVADVLSKSFFILRHEEGRPVQVDRILDILKTARAHALAGERFVVLNRGGSVHFQVPRADVEAAIRWFERRWGP